MPILDHDIVDRIKRISGKSGRYSLYANDRKIIDVDEETLLYFNLRNGSVITADLLAEIHTREKLKAVKDRAFRLLARRSHSIRELADKLRQKESDSSLIEFVLTDLKKNNYLDDEKFASALIKEEIKLRKNGPMLIKKKLHHKGIERNIVDHLLESLYTYEARLDNCRQLAKKKLQSLDRLPINRRKEKLVRYLKQKGYHWQTCEQVLNQLSLEENDE